MLARLSNVYINMRFICLYSSRKIIGVVIIMMEAYLAQHGRVVSLLGKLVSTATSLIK